MLLFKHFTELSTGTILTWGYNMVFEVIGLVKAHASYWMWCSGFCRCLFVYWWKIAVLIQHINFMYVKLFLIFPGYVFDLCMVCSELLFHCLDLLSFHSTGLARHVLVFLIFAKPVLFHWYFCVCLCGFSCLFWPAVALFLFKTLGVRAILLAPLFSFLMWALSTGSFPSSPAVWHPSCFHRLYFHSHMLSVLYNSSGDLS